MWSWDEIGKYVGYGVIMFPVFLIALNSVLQVATRAICKQIWKTRREMTLEEGSKHG